MKKKNHTLPSVIQCDLHTGESKILKYVELTDDEYEKQVVKPLAKIVYNAIRHDIESGQFKPHEIKKD